MRQVHLWCALFLAVSSAAPATAHDPIAWTGPRYYVVECGDKDGNFLDGSCDGQTYLIAGPFKNLTECSHESDAIDEASTGKDDQDLDRMCQKFTSNPSS